MVSGDPLQGDFVCCSVAVIVVVRLEDSGVKSVNKAVEQFKSVTRR